MSLNAFVYIATSLGKRGINTLFRGASSAEKVQKQSSSKKATELFSRLILFSDKSKTKTTIRRTNKAETTKARKMQPWSFQISIKLDTITQ